MQGRFSKIFTAVVLVTAMCSPVLVSAKSAAKAKPLPASQANTPTSQANPPIAKEVPKVSLGDAFITQNTLRIYLDVPVSILVFNTRGQLVYHLDSEKKLVLIPLQDIPTGFLYLTLRSGQNELTKKLVYSGK